MTVMVLVNWWGINLEIGTNFNIVRNQLLISLGLVAIREARLVPPNSFGSQDVVRRPIKSEE